jgi:hypothetical protein
MRMTENEAYWTGVILGLLICIGLVVLLSVL